MNFLSKLAKNNIGLIIFDIFIFKTGYIIITNNI